MANSAKGVFRDVFSNRNILAISFTTTLWSIFNQAWQPYWGLWLQKELGVSIAIVGLLSTIQSAEQLLFQLPGGIIADKFGRKKIVLFGTSLRLIPPIIYLLATNWEHVLVAVIFNASASVYMPAFEAIVADSLPSRQRGAGYGAYRMVTSLPRIFMPTLGGVAMDVLGYKEGVKIFNILTIFTVTATLIIRAKLITETLDRKGEHKEARHTSTRETLLSAFKVHRTIWVMMFVATLGGFGLRMVMQLMPIYAKDFIGLTNTQIGFASTASSALSTILIMPIGMLSDRIGRKVLILVGEVLTPFTMIGFVLVKDFPQYFLLQLVTGIGSAMGGRHMGFAGGPAWQALIADLVPKEKRGTINGIISTVSGAIGTPSPYLGSYIWETYSPEASFIVSTTIALISIPIFAIFAKDPKKGEEE